MRARPIYTDGIEPRVTLQGGKIVLECVITAPPANQDQTVWVEFTPDVARSLRRRVGAALTALNIVGI